MTRITIDRNDPVFQWEYRASISEIISAQADSPHKAIGRLVAAFPTIFGVEIVDRTEDATTSHTGDGATS